MAFTSIRSVAVILCSAALLATSSCSKRPVLVGGSDSEPRRAAIDDCVKQADKAKGDGRLASTMKRGAIGSAASAAAGGGAAAAGNAFGGNYSVGGSMGLSAVAGLIGNVALGAADRDVDPAFARYVESCLSKKGFQTASWD